eukprot:GHVR01174578.1.p1 GENE.GHVR01174578.1~~GHVR01174578.1.p1  ORF type:complete len:717 (+),score=175.91 GHVR01174578.1:217-2367(+)
MTIALDLNNPYSRCEYKKVKAIKFGILSPDEVERMSVCKVDQVEMYDKGRPRAGGLNDLRMGTMDFRLNCESCNMDVKQCPGHFGHVELARACYHIGFINTVLKVLRCVCARCARLLCVDDARLRRRLQGVCGKLKRRQLEQCVELSRTKRFCGVDQPEGQGEQGEPVVGTGCGFAQPKYVKELTGCAITVSDNADDDDDDVQGSSRVLFAEEAMDILRRVSDDDLRLMGFDPEHAHPAWMIISMLPVPPPPVRPSVQFGGDRSEDDITLKLLDIVKVNSKIRQREKDGAPPHLIEELTKVLQWNVFTLVDNGVPGLPKATTRSKKPLKTIRARLKGKEGRIRGNLMGKRVDFSARTVITGDANLDLDQVGVPISVAMTLTYAETVTALNIEELRKLVRAGPYQWPGARFVIREDGTRFDLRFGQGGEVPLEFGYRVERHMRNEDYVLFNRQPSLHKMSIMGHRAKILPYSTFRLNLSVTPPYNADFDGDEMNLHLAQGEETRSEINFLGGMRTGSMAISPEAALAPSSPLQQLLGGSTPAFSATSPHHTSGAFSPVLQAQSPGISQGVYSPTSPVMYSPTSPVYHSTSPATSGRSRVYSGGSYSPTSPAFSPTSPAFSPTSPVWQAQQSPFVSLGPGGAASVIDDEMSPTSPVYSPTSPVYSGQLTGGGVQGGYDPCSPYDLSSILPAPGEGDYGGDGQSPEEEDDESAMEEGYE